MSASEPRLAGATRLHADGGVESVQEVLLPPGPAPDLRALERGYYRWVPIISAGTAVPRWSSEGPDGPLAIRCWPLGWPVAIAMGPPEVVPERRRARPVLGGLLAHPGGEMALELEPAPGGTVLRAALRGFRPRMPWWLYRRTQVGLHERSTYAFLREVARARGARPWKRNAHGAAGPPPG